MAASFVPLNHDSAQPAHLPPAGRSLGGNQHRRQLLGALAAAPIAAAAPVAASADPDAELIATAVGYLQVLAEWDAAPRELDWERSEARTDAFRARADALSERLWDLEPATLRGLAWQMRCEFANASTLRWAAAAMLRGSPTEAELEEASHEVDVLWRFIASLERIAGAQTAGRA